MFGTARPVAAAVRHRNGGISTVFASAVRQLPGSRLGAQTCRKYPGVDRSRWGLTPVFFHVLVLFVKQVQPANECEERASMKVLICAAVLSLLSASASFAQAPAAPAKMSADEKKAISKTCSEQADQKGLDGKDRKKFRSACIKNGGKSQ